jgi:hypothetical protein
LLLLLLLALLPFKQVGGGTTDLGVFNTSGSSESGDTWGRIYESVSAGIFGQHFF